MSTTWNFLLVMKSFLKDHRGLEVLLQLDNSTAVAYINNLGGGGGGGGRDDIPDSHLHGQITLPVGPGKGHNTHSTAHSRSAEYNSRLQIQSGQGQFGIDDIPYGVPEDSWVDLFASRLTCQLPQFFSWRPDPQEEAVDILQHYWSHLKLLSDLQCWSL